MLLSKGINLYLINLLIVNYKEFKKRIKTNPKELFADLKLIIDAELGALGIVNKEKPQTAMMDITRGECSIIFPEATEEEAFKLCNTLKGKIHLYFVKNKLEDVFMSLGVLSYSQQAKGSEKAGSSVNLHIKAIYIGSEIRRFRRVDYKGNIEFCLPEDKMESSETIDISEGGISFFSPRPLKTDALIELRLKFTKTIFLKGRVAWIKELTGLSAHGYHKYKVGLEFAGLKDKERKTISHFIRTLSA